MQVHKPLFLFLAKALLLYIAWNVVYYQWLVPNTLLEPRMTEGIASLTGGMLQICGFPTRVISTYNSEGLFQHSQVVVNNTPSILIGSPCNGLALMVLFAGFIVAYPGKWKWKLGYIVTGCFAIYIINLIRIQILVWNYIYSKESFDFNHKYTYTIIVYLFIFFLWLLWTNRFSTRKSFTNATV
jgi:exosortase family protein XrtF